MTRLLLLTTVLLAGCASSRLPATPPATLSEVNAVLAERWASVELAAGVQIEADNVQIAPDSTTLTNRRTGVEMVIPTERVLLVSMRGPSRVGTGALVGATPGLLLFGLGASAAYAAEQNGDRQAIAPAIVMMGSIPILILGSAAGSVTGALLFSGRTGVIYEAPLSRYPDASPLEPPETHR